MFLDEQFLADLGIADLPEEEKRPLVEGLEEQIQNRISLKMAGELSDEKLVELADLSEGASGDEVVAAQRKWLEENVPGYQEMVLATVEEVKEEILAQKAQALEG